MGKQGNDRFRFLRHQRRPVPEADPPTLWIACTDPIMDLPLATLRELDGSIILRRAGQGFTGRTANGCELVESVTRYVQQGVRDLVICGHSMCSSISTSKTASARSNLAGASGLLQRARQRELSNELGRKRVLQHMAFWPTVPSLSRHIGHGVQVHGLYYLAESGLFMQYDKTTEQFEAILTNHVAG